MANNQSTERTAAKSGTLPQAQQDSALVGAKVRSTRASFVLASQPTADTLELADLPIGARVISITMESSVTLGSSTIAIGITGSTGKYRAAATFTTTDVPTAVGPPASVADDVPLAAAETVFATIAAANLPASGQLIFNITYATHA